MQERKLRLFVLAPSHYCERARWALDYIRRPYEEVRWAPGLHVPLAKRLASATTLPILDTGTQVLQGSDRILDWTRIPAGDPDLERRFETRIGPLVRQYLYCGLLNDSRSDVQSILLDGVSRPQVILGRLMWPITRRFMIAGMNTRSELLPKLERELDAELDWFDTHLDGRDYLVGDSFERADITAASLLAPLARPITCPLYRRQKLPESINEALARWASRPSLRWVERIYAEHRGPALVQRE